ncbi:MAG: hypothetical protein Kow0065_10850 [Methylomicrobium sp.]
MISLIIFLFLVLDCGTVDAASIALNAKDDWLDVLQRQGTEEDRRKKHKADQSAQLLQDAFSQPPLPSAVQPVDTAGRDEKEKEKTAGSAEAELLPEPSQTLRNNRVDHSMPVQSGSMPSFAFDHLSSSGNGFNLVTFSDDWIAQLPFGERNLLIDEVIDEMVDETVNMALRFNEAWNDLDRQITHQLYQGVRYLGYRDESDDAVYAELKKREGFFDDDSQQTDIAHKKKEAVELEGFWAFILYFPKYLTVTNFMWLFMVLLALKGLYRGMRYILLRL